MARGRQLDSVLSSLVTDPTGQAAAVAPQDWRWDDSGLVTAEVPPRQQDDLLSRLTVALAGLLGATLLGAAVAAGFTLAFAQIFANDTALFFGLPLFVPVVGMLTGTTLAVAFRGATPGNYSLATFSCGVVGVLISWFARAWMTDGVVSAFLAFEDPIAFGEAVGVAAIQDLPVLSSSEPVLVVAFIAGQTLLVCLATLALTRLVFGADSD